MRMSFAALALAGALFAAPVAARAQAVIIEADELPPPGTSISARDARAIASDQGMVIVRRLHFDRGFFDRDPHWEVKGRDYRDNHVEMKIDANTGVILDIDR